MPAVCLRPRRVEKYWGRRDLGAFGRVPDQAEPVGELWFEDPRDGARRPALLVKYLFTSQPLSVQVHPDDRAARARGMPCGKDEAWWVVDAERDATIGLGLTRRLSAGELREAALDGRLEALVDWRPVKPGDALVSPGGTIHAIGAGLTVIEVQQNTDVTYRLYDYGRPRELHLEEAVAVARPEPFESAEVPAELGGGRTVLADRPAFVLERWRGGGAALLDPPAGRPAWLIPLAEGARLDGEPLPPGGVWLCEGRGALEREPGADLLVAYPGGGTAELLKPLR